MSLLPLVFLALISTTTCDQRQSATYDYCDTNLKLCLVPSSHTMCRYPIPGLSGNCTSTVSGPLTDAEKLNILTFHNRLRSRVAAGSEKNSIGSLPPASNMMQMYWDEELEEIARRWVDQCVNISATRVYDECRNTKRFQVAQNVGTVGSKGETAEKQIFRVFYSWYTQIKSFDTEMIDSYISSNEHAYTDDFTNIIWAESHAIGCGRVVVLRNVTERQGQYVNTTLWTFDRIVCNYGPGGNVQGEPVYKRGAQCSECPEGSSCSTEYIGLCSLPGAESVKKLTAEEAEAVSVTPPEIPSSEADVTFEGAVANTSLEKTFKYGISSFANETRKSGDWIGMTPEALNISLGTSSSTQAYHKDIGHKKLFLTRGIYLNGMCHCPDLSRFGIRPRWFSKKANKTTTATTQIANRSNEHSGFRNALEMQVTEGGHRRVREAPFGAKSGDRCYCIRSALKRTNQAGQSTFLFNIQLIYLVQFLIYLIP